MLGLLLLYPADRDESIRPDCEVLGVCCTNRTAPMIFSTPRKGHHRLSRGKTSTMASEFAIRDIDGYILQFRQEIG